MKQNLFNAVMYCICLVMIIITGELLNVSAKSFTQGLITSSTAFLLITRK